MAFLLDTNVIIETVKPRPNAEVINWLEQQSPTDLFLASRTIGELVRGAVRVKEKPRRERITRWIEEDLAEQFEDRILPFDDSAAKIWGRLMGQGDREGRRPSAADAQIAAVSIDRELVLVTRNVKDFERLDVEILNPWDA